MSTLWIESISSYVQLDSETQTSKFVVSCRFNQLCCRIFSYFSFALRGTEENIDPSGGMLCYLATIEECPLVDLCWFLGETTSEVMRNVGRLLWQETAMFVLQTEETFWRWNAFLEFCKENCHKQLVGLIATVPQCCFQEVWSNDSNDLLQIPNVRNWTTFGGYDTVAQIVQTYTSVALWLKKIWMKIQMTTACGSVIYFEHYWCLHVGVLQVNERYGLDTIFEYLEHLFEMSWTHHLLAGQDKDSNAKMLDPLLFADLGISDVHRQKTCFFQLSFISLPSLICSCGNHWVDILLKYSLERIDIQDEHFHQLVWEENLQESRTVHRKVILQITFSLLPSPVFAGRSWHSGLLAVATWRTFIRCCRELQVASGFMFPFWVVTFLQQSSMTRL